METDCYIARKKRTEATVFFDGKTSLADAVVWHSAMVLLSNLAAMQI